MKTSEVYELARKLGIATQPEMDEWYAQMFPERYEALRQRYGPPGQGGATTPEALTDSLQGVEGERAEAEESVKL